jgi:hypothetical protein
VVESNPARRRGIETERAPADGAEGGEMSRYTYGDGSTGYVDYAAARITRRAMARIGRPLRTGWRAVGITVQRQTILVIGPNGCWYEV